MRKMSTWSRIAMLALMISLIAAVIVLSVFLGLNTGKMNEHGTTLDNIYQQSYNELINGLNTLETELMKAAAVTGSTLQEKSLEQAASAAEASERALQLFSNENNSTRPLNKLINQAGDYCKYIVKRLEDGGASMSADEKKLITDMAEKVKTIALKLGAMGANTGDGFSFIENLGSENDIFAELTGQLNGEGGIEFPTLIYDGPFSDGLSEREAKGISGDEIDENQAKELAKKYLGDYELGEIKVTGMNEYRIPSFMVEAAIKSGSERTAGLIIAKKGGMLLNMDIYSEVREDTELTIDECKQLAEQYLEQRAGIKNMKAVWATNNGGTVYINLCHSENGVIYYPDMIKVKVALFGGEILGYEGLNYAFNHSERQLSEPKISEEQALLEADQNMKDLTVRLTLIPYSTNTERLAYEVTGKINGDIYLIYVDAESGEEIQVFRVIDSSEGELLM